MKPATLQAFRIEHARGVTKTSGMLVSTVVLLRLRADGSEHVYVLSHEDALALSQQLRTFAEYKPQ